MNGERALDASYLVFACGLYFMLTGTITAGMFYALAKLGKVVAVKREGKRRDKRAARLVVRYLEGILWTTDNPNEQTDMATYLWGRNLLPSWVSPSELSDVPALATRVRESLEFWPRLGIHRRSVFATPSYVYRDLSPAI